jgi:regulator of nucleoside diphosphate kinase
MESEIFVSKLDYSRLNSMILNLLNSKDSKLIDLNRLNIEIKRARLVDPKKINPDRVTMNSVVEIIFSETGISKVFKLVYPGEADLMDGRLSILSPLGCALLGYKKGQSISYQAPCGDQRVTIGNILYQPEANGEDLK